MGVRVKICGITRLGDALEAERLGASAVGFVFYRKSPRYIEPGSAGEISRKLGPFIARVGVFVDEPPESILETVRDARLSAVQLHGSEDMEVVNSLPGVPVIRAVRVPPGLAAGSLETFDAATVLLDAYSPDAYGGTGKTFDWRIAADFAGNRRIILAGGLNPDNIREAVDTVRPWGVDVSSGVEQAPGLKDHGKMAAFFAALGDRRYKRKLL